MNGRLVPTPIVDRNGKATTVHRRPVGPGAGQGRLAGLQPVLAAPEKPSVRTSAVRASDVRKLKPGSLIRSCWSAEEAQRIEDGTEPYGWRRKPMEIPDEDLYAYLRLGIDLADASVLHGLGVAPADVGVDPRFAKHVTEWVVPSAAGEPLAADAAIDALEEAGVPAPQAMKAIENGLRNSHLGNTALGPAELAVVFSTPGLRDGRSDSALIDAILDGWLPWELCRTNNAAQLKRLRREMADQPLMYGDLSEMLAEDRALFLRAAEAGLKRMAKPDVPGVMDHPVGRMLFAHWKHGEAAFDVEEPDILLAEYTGADKILRFVDPDGARYAKQVHDMTPPGAGRWRRGWRRGTSETMGHWHRLDAEPLMRLRDAGLTPEQAHDLLVVQELDPRTAVLAAEAGVTDTVALADGAL